MPVYALDNVRNYIARAGEDIIAARQATPFGPLLTPVAIAPDHTLATGTQAIDGIAYEFEEFEEGESEFQLVARLPDQGVLLAFDLVYARDTHAFVATTFFDHWVSILRTLEAKDVSTMIIGHGTPDRADIPATIAYVEKAKELFEATPEPEAYAAALKAAFPERSQPGWADFSSLLLYKVMVP